MHDQSLNSTDIEIKWCLTNREALPTLCSVVKHATKRIERERRVERNTIVFLPSSWVEFGRNGQIVRCIANLAIFFISFLFCLAFFFWTWNYICYTSVSWVWFLLPYVSLQSNWAWKPFRLCLLYSNVNYGAWHVYKPLFGYSVATFRLTCSEMFLSINQKKTREKSRKRTNIVQFNK